MASSSKSSTKECGESESCDNEKLDDEKMALLAKQYHNYIKRNGVKHFDNNLINFIRQFNSSKQDENKKRKVQMLMF